MKSPSESELTESIDLLSAYRERLKEEVIKISKKLQIPKQKIEDSIAQHEELEQVEKLINQLSEQRARMHE